LKDKKKKKMNQFSLLIPLLCLLSLAISQPYDPDWESIETRPIPSWFTKQKFGIFIHWGVYAVPSYRCLREGEWAEWFILFFFLTINQFIYLVI